MPGPGPWLTAPALLAIMAIRLLPKPKHSRWDDDDEEEAQAQAAAAPGAGAPVRMFFRALLPACRCCCNARTSLCF